MINTSDIDTVVRLFESRSASLYHSCQLMDFESYLQIGAIASERQLAEKSLPATGRLLEGTDAFRDEEDVAFSLSDHGAAFAKQRYAAPNPDGPIMFQLDPGTLKNVAEIDIYLRPESPAAGSESKRLSLAAEDIPYLFRYTDEAPYPERLYIRTPSQIQEAFATAGPMVPEISCRTTDESCSLAQVSATMVDNYLIFKRQLRDWAYDAQLLHGASLPLKRRYCPSDIGGHLADALAVALLSGSTQLEDLTRAENEELSQWAQEMGARRLQENFRRYAAAFRAGTLLYIEQNRDRLLSSTRQQPGKQSALSLKSRQLVNKLVAEKVPPESIARIMDIPLEDIEAYLKQRE